MSHVDEGLITAYLDGAFPPGNEQGEEIEAHLAVCVDCRVLLENARELKERAQVVMHRLAPPEIAVPPFEQIVARGGGPATGGVAASGAEAKARRGWRGLPAVPMAWAASLLLALGAGWMARAYLWPTRFAADTESAAALRSGAPAAESGADAPAGSLLVVPPQTAPAEDRLAESQAPPPAPAVEDAALAGAGRQAMAAEQSADAPRRLERARDEPAAAPPVQTTLGAPAVETVDLRNPVTEEGRVLAAYASATASAAWTAEPMATPVPQIGYAPVARLDDADALRSERATVGDDVVLRTVYRVGTDSVELIQRLIPASVALDAVAVTGQRTDSAAARASQRAARNIAAAEATPDQAFAKVARSVTPGGEAPAFAGQQLVAVTEGGRAVVLRSRLPAAALLALAPRVRR